MNRGSAGQVMSDVLQLIGFNEAPIHESGKSAQRERTLELLPASMRPRFMNRGSDMLTLCLEIERSLLQ